jgi:hypothetical protein
VDSVALSPVSAVVKVGRDHTLTATATSAGQPVEGVNVIFSVAGSVSASGSCATDPSGACSFTYTGPGLPGADTVTACADANDNATADTGEPCGTASVTWIRPVLVVDAFGKGVIANVEGLAHIHFRFHARSVGKHLTGGCRVVDATPAVKVHIKCLDVTSFEQDGDHVTVSGDATIGGVATTFQIDAVDAANPGQGHDTFQIATSSGYSASGVLQSGDIRIRKHWETMSSEVPAPSVTSTVSATGS